MAQYRFSAQVISRGNGRSAIAAAAYRSGSTLIDARTGLIHDFGRRHGVVSAEIIAPDNAPDWMLDREQLWNAVEQVETRSNAQLAREIQFSLPHELTDDERRELLHSFVREQFVSVGMIADVAIHAPDKDGDERNHHAHVMLTMRELMGEGFHPKKATDTARGWNAAERLEQWREAWADHQNRTFERLGIDARVDHRSYADQGIDREATQHLGPTASAMERRGEETRIGDGNRGVDARNAQRAELAAEAAVIDIELERLRRKSPRELAAVTKEQGARHKREWVELKDRNAQRKAALLAARPDRQDIYDRHRADTRADWSAFGKKQAADRRAYWRAERTLAGVVNNALAAVASRQITNGDKGFLRAVLLHVISAGHRKMAMEAMQAKEKQAFAADMKTRLNVKIETAKAAHASRVDAAKKSAAADFNALKIKQDLERARISEAWKIREAEKAAAVRPKGPTDSTRPAKSPTPERRKYAPPVQEKDPVKREFDDAKRKEPPKIDRAPVQRVSVSAPSPQPTPMGDVPAPRHTARDVPKVDKAAEFAKTTQGRAIVDRQTTKAAPDRAKVDWSKSAPSPATPAPASRAAEPSKAKTDWSKPTTDAPRPRRDFQRPTRDRGPEQER